jgi:hypothetical protein
MGAEWVAAMGAGCGAESLHTMVIFQFDINPECRWRLFLKNDQLRPFLQFSMA